MWCLISQPNSVVIEVRVDPKAKGQEVLEKACEILGIGAESDYFGLRSSGVKGVEHWLNLRNPVERQVHASTGQPVRFGLRVKFWVPPHLILQDTTRHQMYLEVRGQVLGGSLMPSGAECRLRLGSLLCQAEAGDYSGAPPEPPAQRSAGLALDVPPEDIACLHAELQGMKTSTAEYWVLKEVSLLENFGEEVFQCKDLMLGIGPHGVTLYRPATQMIPYSAIRSASSLRRLFQLWYLGGDHNESLLEIKCDSCLAASGLYRTLTEKHAFYSCDTVRGAVTAQYIRDLKGTIVSIFNESSALGKKYVFDIRRTCREVHDNARRALYEPGGGRGGCEGGEGSSGGPSGGADEKGASERLATLVDALTCRICMDAGIDTAFFPCAHVICCHVCAGKCSSCPLCRATIDSARRVYLPTLDLALPPPPSNVLPPKLT